MTMPSLAAALLVLFACFFGLGSYPLLDNNEGIYAAIARDMLRGGDYIIPHLNGVPYLEKPPMLYWLLAASMRLFGVNAWAAHLVPALATFATAMMLQSFLTRHAGSEAAGWTAALIFVTSLPLLIMGRMILFDMVMTCFLTAALLCFYAWLFPHPVEAECLASSPLQRKRTHLYGFYAFLALAVLTKGLVALVLAGGTVAAFLLWQHAPRRQWLCTLSPIGIAVFFFIAAPWHILASLHDPHFAWFYFINEHLYRFLNKRLPHDYYTGPVWYYLPRILGYLLPWMPFLLLLRSSRPSVPLKRFLWSWFLFCLLFFSLSGAKANYYMLPGTPPLIMLLALALDAKPSRIATWMPAYILLALPITIATVNSYVERISQKPVADFLKNRGYDRVAMYQEFEELSALAFYMDKPLLMVDSQSEDLLYGQRLSADRAYFVTLTEWMESSPRLPLVVLNKRLGGLLPELHNACIMRHFKRVSVIGECDGQR